MKKITGLFIKSLPLSIVLLSAIFWYTDTLFYFFARDTYILIGIIACYYAITVWTGFGSKVFQKRYSAISAKLSPILCLLSLGSLGLTAYISSPTAPIVFYGALALVFGLEGLRQAHLNPDTQKVHEPSSWISRTAAIVMFLGLLVFYIVLNLHNTNIDSDEIRLIYDARLIIQGLVPFRDFNSRSPALIYILAVLYKLFGIRLTAYRIFTAIVAWGSGVLLYFIGKRFFSRWQALGLAAIYASLPIALNFLYIKTETFEVFFGLLSVLLFVFWLERRNSSYLRYLSHASMLIALLIRPTAIFFYAFHSALSVHDLAREHWVTEIRRHLMEIIVVGLLFTFGTVTFFRSHNTLFYTNTFKPFGIDPFSYMRFLLTPSFIPLTIIVLATIMVFSLLRRGSLQMPKFQLAAAVMMIVLVVSYAANALVLGFWPQYYMDFAVPFAILAMYAITYLYSRVPHRNWYAVITFLVIGLSYVPSYVSLHAYFTANNMTFAELQQTAALIDAHSGPHAIIFDGNPEIALMSDRTQFLNLTHSYYDPGTSAYVIRQLHANPPEIIVVDAEYLGQYYVGQPDFDGLLRSCYASAGTVGTHDPATVYVLGLSCGR